MNRREAALLALMATVVALSGAYVVNRSPQPATHVAALTVRAAPEFETAADQARHGTLVRSSQLEAAAARHAVWMAEHHKLQHSSDAELVADAGSVPVGENVGYTTDATDPWGGGWAARIQSSFLASPEHRAIILDPAWRRVGAAVAFGDDGWAWVDVLFDAHVPSTPAPRPTPSCTPVVRVDCTYRLELGGRP